MPSIGYYVMRSIVKYQLRPTLSRSVEVQRKALDAAAKMGKLPPGGTFKKISLGSIPAEWVTTPNVPEGKKSVILYFHGGGFYEGSCETYRTFAGQLSLASGTRVLTVDYRLAPEHKYPAANEDCLGSYRWLLKNGVPSKEIIIGGDSAGGTLTLMTLLSLRDSGDPLPSAAFTLSAVTDYIDFDGESYVSRAKMDPYKSSVAEVKPDMDRYLDPSKQKETPSILSPLKQDLRGLPPLLLQVGDHEILLSDSVRFAERAKKAGVDITLEIYPNMFHVFQLAFFLMPESKKAIINIGSFIQKHMNMHYK